MQYNFDQNYFDIPKTNTIWILAPGPSLDMFNFSLIKKNHITIACNSVISVYQHPTYQIAFDLASIKYYQKYNYPGLIWFTREKTMQVAAAYNLNQIIVEQIMERQGRGSGLEAIHIAYYLCYFQEAIKNINYVGLDFTDIMNAKNRYYYASCVELLEFQYQWQLPKGWKLKDYTKKMTNHSSYRAQLAQINKIINT